MHRIRLDIRRSGAALKDKEGNVVGNLVKVKVVKNKMAPPFRIALFEIMYGKGISRTGEIIDLGSELDIVQKSGSWYSYKGTKIAQGKESAKQFLEDNQEVAEEISRKIFAHYNMGANGENLESQESSKAEEVAAQ